jgi:hypothetical protein
MIINTEDENDPDYYDEMYGEEGVHHDGTRAVVGRGEEPRDDAEDEYGDEDLYGDENGENDPANVAAIAYYHRHKKFPPMQRIPVEAEYMSNPSDVIDEEEFEDSETDPSSPPKRHRKMNTIEPSKTQTNLGNKPLNQEPKSVPSYMQATKSTSNAV